jgi:hypothetical protein
MISAERKTFCILELINMKMLVSSDYFLERERERETQAYIYRNNHRMVYNRRAYARDNKNKSFNNTSPYSNSVISEAGDNKGYSNLYHFIRTKPVDKILISCRPVHFIPLREDYIRTDPPFI